MYFVQLGTIQAIKTEQSREWLVRTSMVKAALLGAVAALASRADAFYLPGVAPHSFKRGESVELKVNKLTSSRTQVRVSVVYGSVVSHH